MDYVLGQHPLLKKEFIDRRIRELIGHQFVADQLFTYTTVDALVMKYYKDADTDANGRQAYDPVPEIGEASTYPRVGFLEEEVVETIRKYGLEVAITEEMQKYNMVSAIDRAYRKLAQNILKMVDSMAYNKITTNSDIHSNTSAGWASGTNAIDELIDAKTAIKKSGYRADTLVINPDIAAVLLKNKDIRDALRVNNADVALLRGYLGDFLGLSIIEDENLDGKDAIMLQRKIIGDIADAQPLSTKIYNEDQNDRTIVRAVRFTQVGISDPKAIYLLEDVIT